MTADMFAVPASSSSDSQPITSEQEGPTQCSLFTSPIMTTYPSSAVARLDSFGVRGKTSEGGPSNRAHRHYVIDNLKTETNVKNLFSFSNILFLS